MKTLLIAIVGVLISITVTAQVDSAERKMTPPDYVTEPNSEKPVVQDTMKAVPDKTSVKQKQVQPEAKPVDTKSTQNQEPKLSMKDGYVLKNGKVLMIKNGQASSLIETVSLTNGSRLMSDGKIYKRDGSYIMMKEDDFVDLSGNLTTQWPTDNNDQRPAQNEQRPADIQKSNTPPANTKQPVDNTKKEPQKSNDKNMYLVPDSTLKDSKKQSPKQ